MKIGILTYHRAYNYGAFIQSYALAQQLKKYFPEFTIEIIDFSYRYDIQKHKVDQLKILLKYGLNRFLKEHIIRKNFDKSVKLLPLSTRIISDDTSQSVKQISDKYDFVIVGSDAVFNWTLNPLPNVYFFNTDKCPHVTYAASAHLNRYKNATYEETQFVRSALKKFEFIGARDAETERFLEYFGVLSCMHNCDPTVVLEFDYDCVSLQQKMKDKGIEIGQPIICLMLKNRQYGQWIKEVFGNDYLIISLKNDNPFADIFFYDVTPFEWSRIFQYAQITITDYFHGSLLSLKNGTPVISIDTSKYEGEYESKAKDLFYNRLNIPEFYFVGDSREDFLHRCKTIISKNYTKIIKERLENEGKSFFDFCEKFRDLLNDYK